MRTPQGKLLLGLSRRKDDFEAAGDEGVHDLELAQHLTKSACSIKKKSDVRHLQKYC